VTSEPDVLDRLCDISVETRRSDSECRIAWATHHSDVVSPLAHAPSLQPWCDLDGEFVSDEEGVVTRLAGAALDAAIRDQAARFLGQNRDRQLQSVRAEIRAWEAQ
jgi:hypothetical protein